MLKQNITKKKQVHKNIKQINFDIGNNKKDKVKAIQNSIIYAIKLVSQFSELDYLIF